MVKIKRVYEKPSKDDGCRVLVDRLWPRGLKKEAAQIDLWMKEIAPSDELRKWFGHEPVKWADFQKKYRGELSKKEELVAELKGMEKKQGRLTLLFGAKDEEHNQAVALAKFLKKKWELAGKAHKPRLGGVVARNGHPRKDDPTSDLQETARQFGCFARRPKFLP
jgi:uncharacterized protein YeaO (DUF488 family)